MRPSVTVIVLTLNEELNLPSCLESVIGWCQRIFVVDSGSTDGTAAIAEKAGAKVVQHPFDTHAKQWNWALNTLPIESDWVLCLDADHRITPELREELIHTLPNTPSDVVGYYLPRKQIFRRKWIRHGGYWPKYLLKLFRRESAWSDERELVDFRFYVRGQTRCLRKPLVEENEKEGRIGFWLLKHLNFIELQAQEEFLRRHQDIGWAVQPSLWGTPDQRVLWSKQLWYRLPLFLRPFLYFGYRYIIRLGLLDGWEGSLFHFLQGFWLRLMIDVRISEFEKEAALREKDRQET